MASETTTSTMTGAINTSIIAKGQLAYAIDSICFLQRTRMDPVPAGTKTIALGVPTKATALSGTITEATGLSNTALSWSNTTVALAEVGVLRLMTKLAARTNILGDLGAYQFVIEDGGRLCLEKMETDGWAQFANASTSVGTSGQPFTIANFAGALSQLAINKAKGAVNAFLSVYQMRDLRAGLVGSGAAVFADGKQNALLDRQQDDGFCGSFFGTRVFASNLAVTATSDKVGAFVVDSAIRPEQASTGIALGWMPEVEQVVAPEIGRKIAVTSAYGMAEVNDYNYCKVVTIGS